MSKFTLNNAQLGGHIGTRQYTEANDEHKSHLAFSIAERIIKQDQENETRWHWIHAYGEVADKLNPIVEKSKAVMVDASISYYIKEVQGKKMTIPSLTLPSSRCLSVVSWIPQDETQKNSTSLNRNVVTIAGNVANVKMHVGPDKKNRLSFSIAENIDLPENKTMTKWHNFSVFEDTADLMKPILEKAKVAYVQTYLNYHDTIIEDKTYQQTSFTVNSMRALQVIEWKERQIDDKMSA